MTKLYAIRKWINATSVKEAMKLEKSHPPDEVYIADDWFSKVGFIKGSDEKKPIGFNEKK